MISLALPCRLALASRFYPQGLLTGLTLSQKESVGSITGRDFLFFNFRFFLRVGTTSLLAYCTRFCTTIALCSATDCLGRRSLRHPAVDQYR